MAYTARQEVLRLRSPPHQTDSSDPSQRVFPSQGQVEEECQVSPRDGEPAVGACVLGVEEAQAARIKHPPSPAQVMRWPMMDQYKYSCGDREATQALDESFVQHLHTV